MADSVSPGGGTANTGTPVIICAAEIIVYVPVAGSGYPSAMANIVLYSEAQSLLAVQLAPARCFATVAVAVSVEAAVADTSGVLEVVGAMVTVEVDWP